MPTLLAIGDFSRMTYLSVKALRRYHEAGILEPASVDPDTGYRSYATSQVATGQVIRRFRELGMPLDEIRAVLQAPDVAARNDVIVAHLARMESALEQTQATVASLRALLERVETPLSVEFRSVPPVRSLAIAEAVSMPDIWAWCDEAFAELRAAAVQPAGPVSALFTDDFFALAHGEIVAFMPIAGAAGASGRVMPLEIAGGEFAVTLHRGSVEALDQTYGALGTFVAERALGVEGPIREHYLVTETEDVAEHCIEVCWPIFQTRGARP